MEINLDSPFQAFSDHLSKPTNERILFSGPFGYGKSYFLKRYFENNDKYEAFELSPIKYIVGQNEDIFEYIKIDIALQLITNPFLKTERTQEFSEDLYIHQYLKNKPYEIARLLTQTLKDLDLPVVKQVSSLIDNALIAKEKYEAWKEQWQSEAQSDFEKLGDFISNQLKIKGSIYEDDFITQIIRLSLQTVKTKSEKENILIIDDFDRLDPEHIFRILNILSVHQGNDTIENKFGFDKIIIVCSVNNIRNIYEYKYGKEVDFDGYIEKFYSTDIFHFNNQAAIASYCKNQFSSDLDEDSLAVLGMMLSFFVSENYLSIRSLVKHTKISSIRKFKLGPFNFSLPVGKIATEIYTNNPYSKTQEFNENSWGVNYKDPIKSGIEQFFLTSDDFLILKLIQVLNTIFGDYHALKTAIKDLANTQVKFAENYSKSVVVVFLPFIHVVNNFGEPKYIFSSQSLKKDERFINGSRSLVIDLPSFSAINKQITIPVGWDSNNQYDGSVSYFAHVNELLKNESFSLTNDAANISQLIQFLGGMLKMLESNSLLSNLGITN
jgi:hypothetical protein